VGSGCALHRHIRRDSEIAQKLEVRCPVAGNPLCSAFTGDRWPRTLT
jgi:hypothetical protein